MFQKLRKNYKISEPGFSKTPQMENKILTNRAFLNSKTTSPIPMRLSTSHFEKNDTLTTELSTEKIKFKSQLTSLYMV